MRIANLWDLIEPNLYTSLGWQMPLFGWIDVPRYIRFHLDMTGVDRP